MYLKSKQRLRHAIICTGYVDRQLKFTERVARSVTARNVLGIGNPLALHRGEAGTPKTFQHLRAFTPRSLAELLKNQGFTIEHSYGIGCFPFKGKTARILSRLNPSHGALITIKARKP